MIVCHNHNHISQIVQIVVDLSFAFLFTFISSHRIPLLRNLELFAFPCTKLAIYLRQNAQIGAFKWSLWKLKIHRSILMYEGFIRILIEDFKRYLSLYFCKFVVLVLPYVQFQLKSDDCTHAQFTLIYEVILFKSGFYIIIYWMSSNIIVTWRLCEIVRNVVFS